MWGEHRDQLVDQASPTTPISQKMSSSGPHSGSEQMAEAWSAISPSRHPRPIASWPVRLEASRVSWTRTPRHRPWVVVGPGGCLTRMVVDGGGWRFGWRFGWSFRFGVDVRNDQIVQAGSGGRFWTGQKASKMCYSFKLTVVGMLVFL